MKVVNGEPVAKFYSCYRQDDDPRELVEKLNDPLVSAAVEAGYIKIEDIR